MKTLRPRKTTGSSLKAAGRSGAVTPDSAPPFALTPGSSPKKTLALLALLVLGSFCIRLYNLDRQSLECEELYTIPAATGHQYVYITGESSSKEMTMPVTTSDYKRLLTPEDGKGLSEVNGVLKKNVHLPLYFYFMHYWIKLWGTSEWVLRLPSVIFGALSVLLIFFLGKELFSPFVGMVSSLLIAFMPEQIHYSQQARMYPLLALLAISSTYVITLTRKHPSSWVPYVLFALISVAGLYTHYEYVFLLAGQALYVGLIAPLGRQKKFLWLITGGAILIAFAPWLLIGTAQSRTSQEIIAWVRGPLSMGMLSIEIASKLTRLISVPEAPLGWLSVVVTYGLLAWGLLALRFQRVTLSLLCLWIIFPIAGIAVMDRLLGTRAIAIMRYWIIVAPAVYLLIALGVQSLKNSQVQLTLVAVLGGFLFSTAVLTAQGELRAKPDRHKEMARFIDERVGNTNRETILSEGVNSIPLALAYYGERELRMLRYKWVADQLRLQSLGEIIGRDQNVWLLASGPGRAGKLLEDNGYQLNGKPILYGHILLSHYVPRVQSSAPQSIGARDEAVKPH